MTLNVRSQWRFLPVTSGPSGRLLGFLVSVLALLVILHPIVAAWVRLSVTHGHYSHLGLIPAVSAWLLYRSWQQWLPTSKITLMGGAGLAASSLLWFAPAWLFRPAISENDYLALVFAGLVTLVIACYVGFLGWAAARTAAFPLGFLLLAIPVPVAILDGLVLALQHSSAEATYVLFQMTGVPVLRDGFVFALPGVAIEVAKECSGIRSSIALFILALLSGHLALRTNSRKAILVVLSIPLLVLKNAVRIVVLTLLAIHVDPGFLRGSLHRDGGVLFFAVTATILLLLLRLLRRSEPEAASEGRLSAKAPTSSATLTAARS